MQQQHTWVCLNFFLGTNSIVNLQFLDKAPIKKTQNTNKKRAAVKFNL